MDWASRLPDIIDRLMEIAGAAPELEDTVVRDGPALESDTDLSVLYIGWGGGTDDTDAEAQVQGEGLGGNPDREQPMVRCTAWVSSGETDLAPVRRAAFGIMSGMGAAVARDRRLGGLVMRAQMGSYSLTQQQTSRGAQAAVTFEIDMDGYTAR